MNNREILGGRSFATVMVLTLLFAVAAVLLSLCLGTAKLSLSDLRDAIAGGAESGVAGRIFWYARLPRTLATVLAGAALAVSGASSVSTPVPDWQ